MSRFDRPKKGALLKTIDTTPTWEGILPGLIQALLDTEELEVARRVVIEELHNMARSADQAVAQAKGGE